MQNRYSFLRQIVAILATWTLIVTMFPLFPVPTALAFMPDNATANNARTPGSATHETISDRVISLYQNKLFKLGTKDLTENMNKARKEIVDANIDVDNFLKSQLRRTASHFDGENFSGGQKRLMDYKLKIKDLMLQKQPDTKNARWYLGQALHTLQDFYSHSNWIELGRGSTYDILGMPGNPLTDPPLNSLACEDCVRDHCPDCLTHLKATDLTSGYYSVNFDPIGLDPIVILQDRVKPTNGLKCSHGGKVIIRQGPIAVATARDGTGKGDLSAGINKDTKKCEISPHNNQHIEAAESAALATKKYLEHIQVLIKEPKMKLLLGGGPTLAMAIDTTGSMDDIIAQVKLQAIEIVRSRIGTDEEPGHYVLAPFNDPGVGPVFTTDDPYEFMNAISGLTATEGDDCPELSMTGMLQALNSMEDEGGELLMFTDASSKDSFLVGAVEGVALSRSISISPMTFGSCSPTDPAYIRLANNTGGQIFTLSRTEAGTVTQLADLVTRSNLVDVLHVSGTLSGSARTFNVPVDSTITQVTFSVSGTSNVVVTRPDNTVVQPTDPNVSAVTLSSGALYTLTNMPTGTWHVTVNGTGDFSVRAVAESSLDFSFFNVVEFGGPSVHGGYFKIAGFPEANQTRTVLAQVSAKANTAQFDFRNPDGSALQSLSLTELGWENDNPAEESFTVGPVRQFEGQVTPPATAFRTYVTGVDLNGVPYQRVLPTTTKSQTVKVTPPQPVDLTPGQSATYIFKVTNTGGASDTFSLTGSDDKNFLSSVSPTTLTLAAGQTADVSVVLQPPASAGDKALDTLTLTAQSTSASGASNYARVTSVVLPTETLVFETALVTERNGNRNGVIEVGEGGSISARLVNTGSSTASGISVTLSTTTPGITIDTGSSTYPNIAPDAVATNTTPLTFNVNSGVCGQIINLVVTATRSTGGPPLVLDVPVQLGVVTEQTHTTQTISYTGPAVAIPDDNATGVNIPIAVSGFTGAVKDLDFRFDGSSCTTTPQATTVGLDHTFVGDLVVSLTSPQGKKVLLIDRPGFGDNSGNNFCNTHLDDEATGRSVQQLVTEDAPHTGTFKPATPLATFDGENPNGTWTLNVSDRAFADTGSVRAFSLIISDSSCDVPPADNTAPTCELTASHPGPPASIDVSVQDTGVGLAAINILGADNVDVTVSPFSAGETLPVVVTGTLVNPNSNGSFEIQAVDMVGNVLSCNRTITGASVLPPILSENFNDNSLDTLTWTSEDLFSGFIDLSLPIAVTGQRLEIGPLLQNASGSHYRGIRTLSTYDFTGAYTQVELVQPASAATKADAMFTVGYSVDNYYRIYVSEGNLIGLKKVGGVKTTLFTLSFDSINHRFLRIKHDAATNKVVFETAPSAGIGPGSWTQRYNESWNSAVQLSATQFEMKAGTWQPETNPPGKVIFDNFEFGLNNPPASPLTITSLCPTSGSSNGGTPVTIQGTGFLTNVTVRFGGVAATNVQVTSASTLIATTPAHSLGPVGVSVTNASGQTSTLSNAYTYTSPPAAGVILEDSFNDNCLDTLKWTPNNLFSGFIDLSLGLNETMQRLEIGPLMLNASGSHYRGIRTINRYDFTGAYTYVELVQPLSAATKADAMFTVGYDVDNYYRIYVSEGNLIGLKKIGGVKTTLFTLSYDATNHRFLRIRHDAIMNNVVLETAPNSGMGPGSWTQRYSETWNSAVPLSAILFEMKGGTWQPETNAPGKGIFDNFLVSR